MTASAGVSRANAGGFVYFVQPSGRSFVKIGWTISVRERLRALQCGSPEDLLILATVRGSMLDELAWRKRFDHLLVRGEWFRLTEELLSAIADREVMAAKIRGARPVPSLPRKGAYRSKLNPRKVMAIRADKRTVRAVAASYGVSKTCVQDIRIGRTWRHIAQEPPQ